MKYKERNYLIANFMGETISETMGGRASELALNGGLYHKRWAWIMPVVEKIAEIAKNPNDTFLIKLRHYKRNNVSVFDLSITSDINITYKRVLDFINWYNKNK